MGTGGCLFFLFPGIYLGLPLSQSAPLILDGRARGLDSLKISARLTRGARGKLFVVLLPITAVLGLPTLVLDSVAEHPSALTGTLGGIVLVAGWLWQSLVGVFYIYVLVVLYQKLLARQSNAVQAATKLSVIAPSTPGSAPSVSSLPTSHLRCSVDRSSPGIPLRLHQEGAFSALFDCGECIVEGVSNKECQRTQSEPTNDG